MEGFFTTGDTTFWGSTASGVLPIALDTKRICLALRSPYVHSVIGGKTVNESCWGTFGGSCSGLSPQENAKEELEEETGYKGPISLQPSYVFRSGEFKYYNFIGTIPKEAMLTFNPSAQNKWETNGIDWFELDEILGKRTIKNIPVHDGLYLLLTNDSSKLKEITGNENL